MQFIIGVDTGTTNTKAIALATDGRLIAQHAVSYAPFPAPMPGYQEQDPDELFNAMLTALKSVIGQTGTEGLLGISFSSAMHSTIAISSSNKKLTNLITWAAVSY